MAEVKSIQCTIIHLYEPDEFSLQSFNSAGLISRIKEIFLLDLAVPPTPTPQGTSPAVFVGGAYKYKDKEYPIESIQIENRKAVIVGQCPTTILENFYSEFLAVIQEHDSRPTLPEYRSIISTYETIAVCKMTHPFTSLFRNGVVSEIPESVHSEINNHGSTVIVEPFSVRYRIKYRDVPDEIIENKIQLVDKMLILEVREKSAITDRLIYTSSPCDYETHMRLVEIVEGLTE